MKFNWIAVGLLAVTLARNASGQQTVPQIELFAGYLYEHHGVANLNGWRTSVAWDSNRWFGVVADASGQYSERTITLNGVPTKQNVSAYTYLFGPKLSAPTNSRITPFSQFLAGGIHGVGSLKPLGGARSSRSYNGFALATGGGIDMKISGRLAFRIAQAEYSLTRVNQNNSNGIRLSPGPVFRFH